MRESLSPAVRLRIAAESAAGPRVIVAVEDLVALLDAQAGPVAEVSVPAPRAPGTAEPVVVLRPTRADAERLARAAWEAEPGRVAAKGPFGSDEVDARHVARTALETIRQLVGVPAGERGLAPEAVPVPVSVPDAEEEPPF